MYTLQMIADQLEKPLLSAIKLLSADSVSTVRIDTGGPMQEEILYLSPAQKGYTRCTTSKGSSFLYQAELGQTLNRMLEVWAYYSAWEEELMRATRCGCTLSELLDLAYPLIPHPIFILDQDQWMIACSSAIREQDLRGNEDLSDLLKYRSTSTEKIAAFNRDFYEYYQRKDVYPIPGNVFSTKTAYALNLFHNGQFSGVMMIEGFGTEIPQGRLDLFRLLGSLIQEMLNDPSSGLSIGARESSFVRYLNQPSPELKEELRHDLLVAAWKKEDEKQFIYITPSSGRSLSPNLNHAVLMFNRLFGLKAAEYQGGILLFLNMRILKERDGYEPIIERIRQLSYCAGISNSFQDIEELPLAARRAYAALKAGKQEAGAINFFHDYYMNYFFSLIPDSDKRLLRHPILDQLKQYDRRYGSSLYETLFLYLQNERGIAKTATEMKLHRSTLLHRLERIEELSQGLLNQPETRMHILLSYYLEKAQINNNISS